MEDIRSGAMDKLETLCQLPAYRDSVYTWKNVKMSVLFFTELLGKGRNLRHTVMVSSELYSCVADSNNKLQSTRRFLNTAFCGNLSVYKPLDTRTVQPVATCRQSPYVHKPAIVKLLLLIYGFKFRSAFIY